MKQDEVMRELGLFNSIPGLSWDSILKLACKLMITSGARDALNSAANTVTNPVEKLILKAIVAGIDSYGA